MIFLRSILTSFFLASVAVAGPHQSHMEDTNGIPYVQEDATGTNWAEASVADQTQMMIDSNFDARAGGIVYGTTNAHPVFPTNGGRYAFETACPPAWTQDHVIGAATGVYPCGDRTVTNNLNTTNGVPIGPYDHYVFCRISVPGIGYYFTRLNVLTWQGGAIVTNVAAPDGTHIIPTEAIDGPASSINVTTNGSYADGTTNAVNAARFFVRTSAGAPATFTIYGGTNTPTRMTLPQGWAATASSSADGGATSIQRGTNDSYDAGTRTLTYNTNGLGGGGSNNYADQTNGASFSVYLLADKAISATTYTIIPMSNTLIDTHSRWNSTTFRYTFPRTGNWDLSVNPQLSSGGGHNDYAYITVVRNNGSFTNIFLAGVYGVGYTATPAPPPLIPIESTNDYVFFEVYSTAASTIYGVYQIRGCSNFYTFASGRWVP